MHPPGPSSVYEDCAGPRKRLTRMPSPPCARNIFIDGPEEDATPVSLMHRRPPFVSRFRCAGRCGVVQTYLQYLLVPVIGCAKCVACAEGDQNKSGPPLSACMLLTRAGRSLTRTRWSTSMGATTPRCTG